MSVTVCERRPARAQAVDLFDGSAAARDEPGRAAAVRIPWPRVLLVIGVLVVVAALSFSERGLLAASWAALRGMDWVWLGPAAGLEALSMVAFALVHRVLLVAGGVKVSRRAALGIDLAGNAISSSLPLVGSGLGTAFIFRQFQRRGADVVTAGWVLLVSGILSSVTFGAIVAIAALGSHAALATLGGLALTLVLIAAAFLAILALRSEPVRQRLEVRLVRIVALVQGVTRRAGRDPALVVRSTLQRMTTLRLRRTQVGSVVWLATLNWLADVVCLRLAIVAVGGHISWPHLVLAWAAGATASSLDVTPGGLGVVEAAVIAGLSLFGMHPATATAAVLVYRLISYWMPVGTGWVVLLLQRRAQPAPVGASPDPALPDTAPSTTAALQETALLTTAHLTTALPDTATAALQQTAGQETVTPAPVAPASVAWTTRTAVPASVAWTTRTAVPASVAWTTRTAALLRPRHLLPHHARGPLADPRSTPVRLAQAGPMTPAVALTSVLDRPRPSATRGLSRGPSPG